MGLDLIDKIVGELYSYGYINTETANKTHRLKSVEVLEDKILITLTYDEMVWNEEKGDFVWSNGDELD